MGEKTTRKEFNVDANSMVDTIKELIREGNIRRVIVKDRHGKTLIDIPLTVGVAGAVVAPQLAALGALAALLSQVTLVVELEEKQS